MSTLQVVTANITTLSDGTNSTSSTNAIRGSAKAWVNFDGSGTASTNQTIRDSYNISTVYKIATGNFTITFISPLNNSNYCVVGSGADGTTFTTNPGPVQATFGAYSISQNSFNLATVRPGDGGNAASPRDPIIGCVAVFSS